MASVSEQLLAALDDLDADKLKRFKWHFKNYKGFSVAHLEKADAHDTVDLMMKRFGPEEAVKITVDILRKMNQNHVAEELEDKHKKAQDESSIKDPAPAGAESEPIGDKKTIEDWDDMRLDLKITQRMFRQKIQQRQKDLQQLEEAVKSYEYSAGAAVEDSEKMFKELINTIERSCYEVSQRFRDQEKTAVSRAREGLEQLEQEISDLRRRDAELEQLSNTQDHIQFLKSFQSLSAPPESTDVPKIPFGSFFSFDGLKETVRQLTDKLNDVCKEEILNISDRGKVLEIHLLSEISLPSSDILENIILEMCHEWIQDHENHTVLSFQSLSAPPESTDVPKIPFGSFFSFDGLKETVRQLTDKLNDVCKEEILNISDRGKVLEIHLLSEISLPSSDILENIILEMCHEWIQDHENHTVLSFQSLSAPPESTDVPKIPFGSFFSFDGLKETVRQLTDKLNDVCKEEILNISDRVTYNSIASKTRNDLLQYHHQFTLDPNTAHLCIQLSERNRVMAYNGTIEPLPDHPERFGVNNQVLCRESVSERCYWELEWSGNTVYIAVSYKNISRKGRDECWFGHNNKSWTLYCTPKQNFFIHNSKFMLLPVEPISSPRIGVFVDHSAGILSFYSVSKNTMSLIHTEQTTFTQPLHPGFSVECGSVKLC
ncbi:uncharacterized protein LOC132106015 [Carassius carassius]|uniref:uncharacterized protein LOC132106015 n=1 Tax=Carassius carassius TaxID=217509 RepID=UPI002869187A|nr:uncharacterized protein LOC132106015 [Carassius carassius]